MSRPIGILIALGLVSANVFAGTGFLKTERLSGLNKICFYEGVSGTFTKTISGVALCPLNADDGRGASNNFGLGNRNSSSGSSLGGTGFLKTEGTSGMNKTCFYEGVNGTFTKTISAVSLCPLNAQQ